MGRPRNSERDRMSQVQVALNAEWLTAFTAWATLNNQRVPDLVARALLLEYNQYVAALLEQKEQAHDDK